MTTSTTRDKNTRLSPALRLGAGAVWLLLWQLAVQFQLVNTRFFDSPLGVVETILNAITPADYEAARAYVPNPEEYDFHKILNWK